MAKPELLTPPGNIYTDTYSSYETYRNTSNGLLEILAERLYRKLSDEETFDTQTIYTNIMDYMVSMYEIYRRRAEGNIDPVTKELIGEILLNFWPIFQPSKEETVLAMIGYCGSQLNQAMADEDTKTWHHWAKIQLSLRTLLPPEK
ncbi:hypothetical protein HYU90_01845 [Candidatus Collierbacteria bacterium]|nr:hypothetical protein [Candidatus Collierbacteria bacterium]